MVATGIDRLTKQTMIWSGRHTPVRGSGRVLLQAGGGEGWGGGLELENLCTKNSAYSLL